MSNSGGALNAAKEAFCETIRLKLEQFYRVVPMGVNNELTGDYVEEVVRSFIEDWISPCKLMKGTLYPHSTNVGLRVEDQNPKQIDGIVFDPRLGPYIIREGSFAICHPYFCRGIIEVKTSVASLRDLENRLQELYYQYMYASDGTMPQVMGIVIRDSNPTEHSRPDWMIGTTGGSSTQYSLFNTNQANHCPIFVLFDDDYNPYDAAIDAMIRAIFRGALHHSRPPM